MELKPSTLDLWEIVDPKAPSEALYAQPRPKPIDYKNRIPPEATGITPGRETQSW